jgi:hypothetical protein
LDEYNKEKEMERKKENNSTNLENSSSEFKQVGLYVDINANLNK